MTEHKVTDICYSYCLPLSWVVSEIAHGLMHACYSSLNYILEEMNSQCILLESSEPPGLVTSSLG